MRELIKDDEVGVEIPARPVAWLGPLSRPEHLINVSFPAFLLALTIIITTASVIGRYVFNNPLGWATETAGVLFCWQVMLASAGALAREEHISIVALSSRLRGHAKLVHQFVVETVVLTLLIAVSIIGYSFTAQAGDRPIQSLGISYQYVDAAIPAGFALAAAITAVRLAGIARKLIAAFRTGEGSPDAESARLETP